MQTDPIGYKDGMNWYAYVGNDPVNASDPSGLCDSRGGPCENSDGSVELTGTFCFAKCQAEREANNNMWSNMGYVQYATAQDRNNQAAYNSYLRANVDPMMEKGLLTYTGVVVGSGLAIGACIEACPLVFTARAAASGIGKVTEHGLERLAGAAATRGGVLSAEEVSQVRAAADEVYSQKNGAIAIVQDLGNGKFNVVIQNAQGAFMTGIKNISAGSLARLASNYGWQ